MLMLKLKYKCFVQKGFQNTNIPKNVELYGKTSNSIYVNL